MNLYFASLIVPKKGKNGEFEDNEFSLNWSEVNIFGKSLNVAQELPSFPEAPYPGFFISWASLHSLVSRVDWELVELV